MNARAERWFRGLLWALVIYLAVMSIIALADLFFHPLAPSPYPNLDNTTIFRWLIPLIGGVPTFIVGLLVLRRERKNIIGLLVLIWAGCLFSFAISVDVSPWIYNLASLPISAYWVALFFIPFYFPNGQTSSRSLTIPLALYYAAQLPVGFLTLARLEHLPLRGDPLNPWYIAGSEMLYNIVVNNTSILTIPIIIALFVSPYRRYRRASAYEKQQIKWLVWVAIFVLAPYVLIYITAVTSYPNMADAPRWLVDSVRAYQIVVMLYPAITIGNAILRHRLYDIDIIIRRTLIYSILSAILAAVYFGSVILVQALFQSATGEVPDAAIVLSTLLIAALFTPVRRRVQDVIDRRFYRRKYDVEQTLAEFNATLRDEVDMETLQANLLRVVNDTMQPTQIALWIKEPTKGKSS